MFPAIASNRTLVDQLRQQKFDVGVSEMFFMTEYALAFLRWLGIPRIVATSATTVNAAHYYYLGLLNRVKAANYPRMCAKLPVNWPMNFQNPKFTK